MGSSSHLANGSLLPSPRQQHRTKTSKIFIIICWREVIILMIVEASMRIEVNSNNGFCLFVKILQVINSHSFDMFSFSSQGRSAWKNKFSLFFMEQ